MQNRKFFATLTAAIALTAGLASCSTNDDELNPKNEGRIPITLTSNVGSRATDQSLQETQIANGVNVGVFITQGTTNIATNNMLTSSGDGGFTGNAGSTDDATTALNIYAYAPHNSDWSDLNTAYTFTVGDQAEESDYYAADLMIAEPVNTDPTTNAINLTFKHKMAKLNLNFDLTGAPADFSLDGATVSVLNVLPSVSVKVSDASIGTASGSATTIKAATLTASDTKASVVFPPQTIAQNAEFVQVTVDGNTYKASLPSDVAFESGKKYTYTVTFTTSGGGDGGSTVTGIKLTPTASVTPWEDAHLIACEIGDYVTSDGQIISKNASDLIAQNQANIVAVIFSKEVSELDKLAGYNAYAMRLQRVSGKKWTETVEEENPTIIESITSNYADVLADLDGRIKTAGVITAVPAVVASNTYIFEFCNRDANKSPVGTLGSDWFVPSIGQMIQIFNNLGSAGINADTEVIMTNGSSPVYTSTDFSVITSINAYATTVGIESDLPFNESASGTETYATVTEAGANFWCFQCRIDGGDKWGFGKNTGKTSPGRNFIPCVALTLSSSTSIPASATAE